MITFGTDLFLRLMPSAANGCYEINLSWYPVSSKLASYICEHYRLFADSLYKKIINIGQYLLKLLENFLGVRFFEPHCSFKYVIDFLCFERR